MFGYADDHARGQSTPVRRSPGWRRHLRPIERLRSGQAPRHGRVGVVNRGGGLYGVTVAFDDLTTQSYIIPDSMATIEAVTISALAMAVLSRVQHRPGHHAPPQAPALRSKDMSDLQVDIDPVEIIDGELGTESTSAMFGQGIDRYGTVAVTDTPAEMLSSLQEETPAELWPSLQKMIDQVEDVTGLKWVQPLEVPAFFDWLNVDQGIAAITPEWVDSGQLYNYAYSWAQATGALPPGIPVSAPATAPVPAPVLTTPTQGTATTAAVAGTLVQRSVTAPGLTVAEAKAISTAISVALGDVQTLVAGGIDKMLPNLAPGQVPQALSQLYSAVAILERQYAAMRQQLSGPMTAPCFRPWRR